MIKLLRFFVLINSINYVIICINNLIQIRKPDLVISWGGSYEPLEPPLVTGLATFDLVLLDVWRWLKLPAATLRRDLRRAPLTQRLTSRISTFDLVLLDVTDRQTDGQTDILPPATYIGIRVARYWQRCRQKEHRASVHCNPSTRTSNSVLNTKALSLRLQPNLPNNFKFSSLNLKHW